MEGLITAWGKILRGYNPSLSIEIRVGTIFESSLRIGRAVRTRREAVA
jgi:hypothetical protein